MSKWGRVEIMKDDLWKACRTCKTKYCCSDIAYPLFVTPQEKIINKGINTLNPCIFFRGGLCKIHSSRPLDCKFFPFEIMKIRGKYQWIYWEIPCQITDGRNKKYFEKYLLEHENTLLPKFLKYIDEYSEFRIEELKRKFKFKVIREVNFI